MRDRRPKLSAARLPPQLPPSQPRRRRSRMWCPPRPARLGYACIENHPFARIVSHDAKALSTKTKRKLPIQRPDFDLAPVWTIAVGIVGDKPTAFAYEGGCKKI